MKIKQYIEYILPKYAHIPLAVTLIFRYSQYFFTKLITEDHVHYDLSLPIDDVIPFVPFFILFYVLAYIQWFSSYVFHAKAGKDEFYHLMMIDIITNIIGMICFLVIPTTIVRPEITENGIFESITKLIYHLDTPVNLFPSMHCVTSWICFKGALMMKNTPKWYPFLQFVFTLFVFASTVFVKQHFFIDIIAGVVFVEISAFISKRFSVWKILNRLAPKVRL